MGLLSQKRKCLVAARVLVHIKEMEPENVVLGTIEFIIGVIGGKIVTLHN